MPGRRRCYGEPCALCSGKFKRPRPEISRHALRGRKSLIRCADFLCPHFSEHAPGNVSCILYVNGNLAIARPASGGAAHVCTDSNFLVEKALGPYPLHKIFVPHIAFLSEREASLSQELHNSRGSSELAIGDYPDPAFTVSRPSVETGSLRLEGAQQITAGPSRTMLATGEDGSD